MILWSWIVLILILARPVVVRLYRQWVRTPAEFHRDPSLPYETQSNLGGRDRLTPEAAAEFDDLLSQFHAEGFDEVTFSFTQSPSSDVTGVQAFLVNRRDGQMASLIASNSIVTSTRGLVISVGCLFEDGSSICTGTRKEARIFPEDPADDRITANWIRDAHTLCEFQRRRLAASPKSNLPRLVPPPGGELAFLAAEWARVRDRLLAAGMVRRDPADPRLLRYTWKGAFLVTYRLTDGGRRLQGNRDGRRAYEAWRELDMASFTSPAPPSAQPALPADDAAATAPAEPASAQLRYEMVLEPGQIAEEPIPPDILAVRMGMPTKLRYLISRWPTLLWIALLGAVTIYWAIKLDPAITRQRANVRDRLAVLLPATTLFLFIFTFGKLVLQVLAHRGMILLTASPRGLTYRNVPFLGGRGAVARSNVRALLVLPYPDAARNDLHTLFLVAHNVRLPLLITPDRDRLQSVRARIAQAMGIDPIPTPTLDPS